MIVLFSLYLKIFVSTVDSRLFGCKDKHNNRNDKGMRGKNDEKPRGWPLELLVVAKDLQPPKGLL
jgi:hypothetical protein